MRRSVLSTFLLATILGLGCISVILPAKAYGHCEDPNDPQYDPNECEEVSETNTLEAAKKVTGAFDTSVFVRSPRSISDITTILNKDDENSVAMVEQWRRKADAQEPATDDRKERIRFFRDRGLAASLLGLGQQAAKDVSYAVSLLTTTEKMDWQGQDLIRNLANIYRDLGNQREALKLTKEIIGFGDQECPMCMIAMLAPHAWFLAGIGDLEGAKRALEQGDQYAEWVEMKLNHDSSVRYLVVTTQTLAITHGRVSFLEGAYPQAEKQFSDAIAILEKDIEENPFGSELMPGGESISGLLHWMKYRAHGFLAQTLARQNRLNEAETHARNAIRGQITHFGRYSVRTARGVRILADVLSEQGRFEEAAALSKIIIDIFENMGHGPNSLTLSLAKRSLADIYTGQAHWQESLSLYQEIEQNLASDPGALQFLRSINMNWALPYIRAGRGEDIKQRLRTLLGSLKERVGKKHYEVAEVRALLASALASTGHDKGALELFSMAVPILLSRSRTSEDTDSSRSMRERRLVFALESYIDLLSKIHGGPLGGHGGITSFSESFRMAEAVRARSVQTALAASAARFGANTPELSDLVRREQDAGTQIGAYFSLLSKIASSPGITPDLKLQGSLRIKIDQLREARATLMEEIENHFPEYAQLINPKPPTIKLAQSTLAHGEALIATYVGTDRTYVWAIPHIGEVAFAAVDLGWEDIEDTVAFLRVALDPNARTLGDIPEFDVAEAYSLYEKLLKPVEAGWKGAKNLLVVAHGPLGYLPFSLLPTQPTSLAAEKGLLFDNYRDVPWLVQTHSVTMLPSVASLLALRKLPVGKATRKAFVGFGDPWFNKEQAVEAKSDTAKTIKIAALVSRGFKTRGLPVRLRAAPATSELDSAELGQLPRLSDTADEVRAMAEALKADLTKDVFLGDRASEGSVKTAKLSGYRVISFATHGLVPGDLNGLTQPALALSAPDVANDPGNDGLLTMGEILGLKLDADWVVLSACNTGSGEGAGAEAVSGLGRAFFYAGTRALLVSNWPVETTSARALTSELFKRQAANDNLSRAGALRESMLSLIEGPGLVDPESGKTVFSYAHPIFWAPFSLIGDGGGKKLTR